MPDMSPNQVELRASGNWMRVYVSFLVGNVVATGSVTATPANGATTLAVTVSTGDYNDIRRGMTVYIKSSGGDLKGVTRVRYSGQTIDATNLPIRENARGTINIVSGDTWEVRDDVRLSDKLVEANGAFNPDGLAYSDQNSNQRPIACSGGHWAGDVSMLPITTAGSASVTVDPDSGGTVTHLWTLPSGLSFVSPSVATDANPTITGDAGEYWVTHAVTDDDNGETTTQYVGYKITDDDNPPFECLMEAPSGDEENGWSVLFRPFDPVLLTAIPDGCLAIVWKQEYMAGSQQSFGAAVTGRSHILMTGYLRRENGAFTGETGVEELTFEIISPMARLEELIGYSKVMISEASPDAWSEMKTLTVRRAILQIAAVYTSLQQAGFDFIVHSNFSDAVYPRFYEQKQNPRDVINELADARDARLICDRTGRFELQTRPELVPIADRASAVITLTLENDDVIDWEYTREHWEPVEILECQGLTAGANPAAVFSRWPGLTPGTGNEATTHTRLIADTQTDLNLRTARRGAALNGVFMDANGVKQQAVDLTITLPGSYHVFDFYAEYVQFDKLTTLRGLDFLDQLFYAKSVAFEPDDRGAGKVRLTLRTATNAVGAQTYVPPTEADSNLPIAPAAGLDWNPGSLSFSGLGALGGLVRGTQVVAYFTSDGMLHTTGDFDTPAIAGGPTWVTTDLTALANWGGSVLCDFTVDAFSPGYPGGGSAAGGAVNGWIATDEQVQRITDIFGTPALGTPTVFTNVATTPAVQMNFERGVPNWGIVVNSGSFGLDLLYTTDGATWTEVLGAGGDTFEDTTGAAWASGLAVSPHTAGRAYFSVMDATGSSAAASPTGRLKKTLDYGATSSDLGISCGLMRTGCIHVPYQQADMLVVFHGYLAGTAANDPHLYRSIPGGAQVDISYNDGSNDYGIDNNNSNRQIATCDADKNVLVYVGSATTGRGVFKTQNAYAAAPTWTVLVTPSGSCPYTNVYVVDPITYYLFGPSGNIAVVTDGATVDSRVGDLVSAGTGVGLCGGGAA